MTPIEPNVIVQLNQWAMASVNIILQETEQKLVKPLDSTFGEWVSSNFKVDIKDLKGFKAVAGGFRSKLADILQKRANMRAKAPAEQYTYLWKAVGQLFNTKMDELEKIPKDVKNHMYIQMCIKMARMYYKLITTDTTDPDKQLKALLDETKAAFAEIKKKMPKK
jgi:hypothetical protein